MSEPTRSYDDPHDRLTAIADAMLDAMKKHPDATGNERAVVFLADPSTRMNGTGMLVDDEVDAVVIVLEHLEAMLAVQGKRLVVLPLGEG